MVHFYLKNKVINDKTSGATPPVEALRGLLLTGPGAVRSLVTDRRSGVLAQVVWTGGGHPSSPPIPGQDCVSPRPLHPLLQGGSTWLSPSSHQPTPPQHPSNRSQ